MKWFKKTLAVKLPIMGYQSITISHMGHSSGGVWFEIMHNGKMYGKFYRKWRTKK